jgi:hypothetical protein
MKNQKNLIFLHAFFSNGSVDMIIIEVNVGEEMVYYLSSFSINQIPYKLLNKKYPHVTVG